MATKRGKQVRERRIALGEDLRIGRAREVLDALAVAGPPATVVIEASSVSKVDTAGLQAIACCIAQWRATGAPWRWDRPSEPLRAAARAAGLQAALELE
jgi:anti-anti-sigma regulatory factor